MFNAVLFIKKSLDRQWTLTARSERSLSEPYFRSRIQKGVSPVASKSPIGTVHIFLWHYFWLYIDYDDQILSNQFQLQ